MENAIVTRNLTKHFGTFRAVESVSLNVENGEIYGFLGLNGAGKTTTIRMLLGLIKPTHGDVFVNGERILPGGKGPWHQVGSLVEIPHSYPELTVRENIDIVRRIRGIGNRHAVEDIAARLKLSRYIDKKAGLLSLGNAQRLGLAKALIHQPSILILDEPSNGLDPAGIVEIRELLIDLSRNRSVTIFVSSHLLDEIARLATRIGIIHEGVLIKELDISQLHSICRKRLLVGTRDTVRAKQLLSSKGYSVTGIDNHLLELTDNDALQNPDTIATLLVQSGIPPTSLWQKEENLESIFLRIIESEGSHYG